MNSWRLSSEMCPALVKHLDRLKPLRLGQLDFLDEGVQVLDQTEHDLP